MSYSDYGGYAYRNGSRIAERSDATISPDGDVFGTPGMWPGFAALLAGGKDELLKRQEWPSGHVVLGDGPIYVALYKQSCVSLCRGPERLDPLAFLKGAPPEAVVDYDGKSYLNHDYFKDLGECCVFEVDGWRLEVFFQIEDNHYQYARLAQPNGVVWHGWSGYGVGAGLEDCDYGFSTAERDLSMQALWPSDTFKKE
jgi:hypothetical protein